MQIKLFNMFKFFEEAMDNNLGKALNQPESNNELLGKAESGNAKQIDKEDIAKVMVDLVDKFTLQDAINRLRKELQKDKQPGSYYHTWQCNIAQCFYDAYAHYYDPVLGGDLHHIRDISNLAAVRFLEILCQQTDSDIGLIKQSELQGLQSNAPQQSQK